MKFGVEIEGKGFNVERAAQVLREAGVSVEGGTPGYYTHRVSHQWKVVYDGSVSGGYEVVSPVLDGEEGLEELTRVMNLLTRAGGRVDRQCGLHVHHDVRGKTYARDNRLLNGAFQKLLDTYKHFEPVLDSLMAPSRRGNGNTYCMSVGGFTTPNMTGRYYKLNFAAFQRHGTVEFRQHQGTLDAAKATMWVRLTHRMVVRSWGPMYRQLVPTAFPQTLAGMMDYVNAPQEMRAFFQQRQEQLRRGGDNENRRWNTGLSTDERLEQARQDFGIPYAGGRIRRSRRSETSMSDEERERRSLYNRERYYRLQGRHAQADRIREEREARFPLRRARRR